MATTFTSETLKGTYNDDFDKDKNFHQILFNSGRALQARELTQLQTLIYQETSRLGRNIFKEGAAVSSGAMAINSSLEYVKIASTNAGGAFKDIPLNTIFRDDATGLEAKVLRVEERNSGDGFTFDTLYVQYIDNDSVTPAGIPQRFGDKVTLFDQSGTGYELVTETPSASGRAVRFDVEEGDFFVLGRFVHAPKQSIILNAYDQSFTGTVGFKVVQEVVAVADDTSLYDNTGGTVNTAAPGADRYRITLTLADYADITTDDTFVFLANIENSKIVEEVTESDAYNKINELLALRTSEESGDYVVDPFQIHFEDATSGDSTLELIVSAGTAYVNGFRTENPSAIKLNVPRPQQTDNFNNDAVPIEYGNYFIVDSGAGAPNLDFATVTLSKSRSSYTGANKVGTARIRAVENASGISPLPNQATHKVYLQDVLIDSDKDIGDARFIGTSTSNHYRIALGDSATAGVEARLFDVRNNDLLMPLTQPRLESMSDIVLKVQRHVGSKTVASSAIDISSELGAGESFVDRTNWIVSSSSRAFIPHTAAANGTITLTDVDDGVSLEVLYYVQKTGSVRTKTKIDDVTATLTKETAFDATNSVAYNYYEFPHADIFAVDSVRNTNDSGLDMLSQFTLDDGQRDNFYQHGRLILNREDSAPENIYVKYSHLRHNNDGDFFAASSYNTIGYTNIPKHTLSTGQEVGLYNFLDFRSTDSGGTYTSTKINYLPKSGDNVTADIGYYLPRADKLIMTQEGEIQLLMGQQAANPQYKPTPANAIELYKIRMNPNTLDENDLSFTEIEYPHYTMKDIADLEAKVDRLEEYTRLSFLELQHRLQPSLDSAGNERLEVGSTTDECADQTRSDTENEDYAASLDPEDQVIRPLADENNINLVMDSAASDGVILKGDNIYLTYDSAEWAYQELASTHVNVNPNSNSQNIGTIKLSPSSDEWKDSFTKATRAIQGTNKLDVDQAKLWNSWQWNWQGRSSEEREVSYPYDRRGDVENGRLFNDVSERYTSSRRPPGTLGTPKNVRRVVFSDTLRRRVGNRYVDLALIPWIRSRKVFFHAKGLTPNTKFTPFFDGVKVDDWVREESSFTTWSNRDDEIGNRYGNNLSAHPDGSSDLISDANGEIIGSFFIPSLRAPIKYRARNGKPLYGAQGQRFRSGLREFMLLDINKADWGQAGSKAFAYYAAFGFMFGLWNRWNWTRYPDSMHPYSWISKRQATFSNKEVKNRLDQVASSAINLVDPKLAGKYGTNDIGLVLTELRNIDNNNNMSSVLSDYISVDQNHQAGTNSDPIPTPENPLAQTFYVDNPFGLVLTKVQLYFRAKDSGTLPVSIHLRPVEDGRPSENTIVPDSHVYLKPSEVTAIGTSPVLSTIQASPTTFEFTEPVYLQPWTRYAIVVQSQSTEYELFSAKTLERVFGSTTRTITTQPIPGELFLPANGGNYVGSKDQDLMYRLIRAKFDQGGGSLVLKNALMPLKELEPNSIHTSNGSTTVTIKHSQHGHKVGDTVNVAGAVATNGVPASEINQNQTITAVSLNQYQFAVSTSATATGFGGGDEVRATENHVFSVANLQLENAIPRSSSIDVSAKFTSGAYISSGSTRFTVDPQYRRITPGQNVDFEVPRAIYNTITETSGLGAGNRSASVKVDLKSGDDYVSPIIDLQRTSLIVAGYAIDNPDTHPSLIQNVAETNPSGGTSGSKHITLPVRLPEPAVGIDARCFSNIPDSADVEFYFRTADADEDLWTQPWTRINPVNNLPKRNDNTYEQLEFLPGGKNGTLNPFYQSQAKFILKGGNKPPSIRDLQIRYLAQ